MIWAAASSKILMNKFLDFWICCCPAIIIWNCFPPLFFKQHKVSPTYTFFPSRFFTTSRRTCHSSFVDLSSPVSFLPLHVISDTTMFRWGLCGGHTICCMTPCSSCGWRDFFMTPTVYFDVLSRCRVSVNSIRCLPDGVVWWKHL